MAALTPWQTVRPDRSLVLAAALLTAALAAPWLFTLAGDAQVHLAVAEQFSQGHPFEYNPGGEMVAASTSPFWTLLLASFFTLVGAWSPLLVKLTVVALWLASGYLLYRAARDVWRMHGYVLLAVVGLWFTQTMITGNALGGLENILSAFQVLWIYYLTCRWSGELSPRRAVTLGLLFGWTVLTRPDGALFAAGVLALCLLAGRLSPQGLSARAWAGRLALLAVAALVIILPWYVYQYQVTGKLLTDSALARLYTGRRGSFTLISNLLYFHPKSIISLATAFFPLMAGCAVLLFALARERRRGAARLVECYPQITALAIGIAAVLFYTFIVGGDSFGRYFLPIFPFYFLAGIAGLVSLQDLLPRWRVLNASLLLMLTALFLLGTSGLDFYRRIFVERFDNGPTLNVIYGPASIKYFAFNLGDIIAAPQDRARRSAELKRTLGMGDEPNLRFAVTEVQLRYFVDDSVSIISLDGRASSAIMQYVDPVTGMVDFGSYFRATRPDLVHVAQWCFIGDWHASIMKSGLAPNLVCEWQQQTAHMQVGDSFSWDGNRVIYVGPDIVRILWQAN